MLTELMGDIEDSKTKRNKKRVTSGIHKLNPTKKFPRSSPNVFTVLFCCLKGHSQEIFEPRFFSSINPTSVTAFLHMFANLQINS
jgi:hypothetical protein